MNGNQEIEEKETDQRRHGLRYEGSDGQKKKWQSKTHGIYRFGIDKGREQ
jgi:hypothetical protein